MIRLLLLLLVVVVVGLFAGPTLEGQQGYVAIVAFGYAIEMSLTALVLSVVLLVVVLGLCWRLLRGSVALGQRAQRHFSGRRERRAQALTQTGTLALLAGQWNEAEQKLRKAARLSAEPQLALLGAAQAAQAEGQLGRRDQYLQRLPTAKASLEIGLARLNLLAQQPDLTPALAEAEALRQRYPKAAALLMQLLALYQATQQWDKVLALLPEIRLQKLMSEAEMAPIEQQARLHQLQALGDLAELRQFWQALPRSVSKQADCIAAYARGLIAHQQHEEAQTLLLEALSQQRQPQLLACLAEVDSPTPEPLLQQAKGWLNRRKPDADLLQLLGQLSFHAHRLDEAKDYFEQAVALAPSAARYQALAQLCQQLNQHAEAAKHYHAALQC